MPSIFWGVLSLKGRWALRPNDFNRQQSGCPLRGLLQHAHHRNELHRAAESDAYFSVVMFMLAAGYFALK
jgi:hypothetical protein